VSGSVQPARAGSLGGADPVGSVEVGKHQDVKQLGASRRREGLEASPEGLLHLVRSSAHQSPDNGPDRQRDADHDRAGYKYQEDSPPVRFDRRWSRCDQVLEPIKGPHIERIGLPPAEPRT
jgi:hypothetical protein